MDAGRANWTGGREKSLERRGWEQLDQTGKGDSSNTNYTKSQKVI